MIWKIVSHYLKFFAKTNEFFYLKISSVFVRELV